MSTAQAKALPKPRARVAQLSTKAAAALTTTITGKLQGAGLGTQTIPPVIGYRHGKGVESFVREFLDATPMDRMAIERQGVQGIFFKDLSKSLGMPSSRLFTVLGIPRATAEKAAANGSVVAGRGGPATVGMLKLLGIAQDIVANSTSPEAEGFDSAKWLGRWIERPQPALGGRKPADLLDTTIGVDVVARLLGAIESGAYQ